MCLHVKDDTFVMCANAELDPVKTVCDWHTMKKVQLEPIKIDVTDTQLRLC